MKQPNRLIRDDDVLDVTTPPAPVASRPPPSDDLPRGGSAADAMSATRQVSASVGGRARRRRAGGQGAYPGRRQLTAYIERDLFLWLKAISAESDKPMIAIMEEALSEFVQRHAAQRKFSAR